ncbi:MAG: hypothetical protein K6G81_10655 [Lachnospiraceae bacterium]|nr:hypothetical protein [Lachnospiraceae bacterium]
MRRISYIFAALLISACTVGCSSHKDPPLINAVTPTTGVEPTMEVRPLSPAQTASKPDASATPHLTPGEADEPDSSGLTAAPDENGDSNENDIEQDIPAGTDTDSGNNGEKTTDNDSGGETEPAGDAQGPEADTGDPSGSGEDTLSTDTEGTDSSEQSSGGSDTDTKVSAAVKEYWLNSFLVWLPLFEKGSFIDTNHDETHDYIMLGNISDSDLEQYIGLLTDSGFNTTAGYLEPSDFRFGGTLEYTASNQDGWEAFIDYDSAGKTAIIGSGYHSVHADGYQKLIDTTLLGLIPRFTYGIFDSGRFEDDTQYAVFYDAAPGCAAYIDELKAAGFTLEADEGNESDIIWYNAASPAGLACEFIYTDGMVRIGCRHEQ